MDITIVKVKVGKETSEEGEWEDLDYCDLEDFIFAGADPSEFREESELMKPLEDEERDRLVQDMIDGLVGEGCAERVGKNAIMITDRSKHFETKWDRFRREAERLAGLGSRRFAEMSVSNRGGLTEIGLAIRTLTEAWSDCYGIHWFDEDEGFPFSIDEYIAKHLDNGDVVTFGEAAGVRLL